VDVLDLDAARKLHDWFNARWDDARCLDITEELVAIIQESWAGDRLVEAKPRLPVAQARWTPTSSHLLALPWGCVLPVE